MKIEPAAAGDLDEIARMVQAVQDSVMKEFLSAPDPSVEHKPEPEPKPDPNPEPEPEHGPGPTPHIEQSVEIFETTEHDLANLESASEAALDQPRSLSRDIEPRPDTLWNNPRDYTRRKHIIPALGALVSAANPRLT